MALTMPSSICVLNCRSLPERVVAAAQLPEAAQHFELVAAATTRPVSAASSCRKLDAPCARSSASSRSRVIASRSPLDLLVERRQVLLRGRGRPGSLRGVAVEVFRDLDVLLDALPDARLLLASFSGSASKSGSSFSTSPRSLRRRRSEGGSMTPFVPASTCARMRASRVELAQREPQVEQAPQRFRRASALRCVACVPDLLQLAARSERRDRSPARSAARSRPAAAASACHRVPLPRHLASAAARSLSSRATRLPRVAVDDVLGLLLLPFRHSLRAVNREP